MQRLFILKPQIHNPGRFKKSNEIDKTVVNRYIVVSNPSNFHYRREHASRRFCLSSDTSIKMKFYKFNQDSIIFHMNPLEKSWPRWTFHLLNLVKKRPSCTNLFTYKVKMGHRRKCELWGLPRIFGMEKHKRTIQNHIKNIWKMLLPVDLQKVKYFACYIISSNLVDFSSASISL